MDAMMTVARKEFRALFRSPVALMFLATFLVAVLFTFFTWSTFWARNLADARPLFAWLPLLLVFLVSAVSMRAWAEEQRSGTLEILLTLPVHTTHLVLGKFAAGMALIGAALLFTLPIPWMVSVIGPLDWGPVIGGYVGALLLGAAYLSIGLCVSARTDNQVVALMTTLLIGSALYLIGTPRIGGLFDASTAEILSALGTGARFESIERGVIDLRDVAYYAAIAVSFLALNVWFLDSRRVDAGSETGAARARAARLLVALIAANAVAATAWLAPVRGLRVDLTEHGDYTLSPATKSILGASPEPIVIQGFFSARTHELLNPLVPRLRDLLAEYEVAGAGRVTVSFADPSEDEELEAEIGEQYGIRSVPFGVADRHSQGVVNAFFHVLVRTGDKYEVLSFAELVEVRPEADKMDVQLGNVEYDISRAIKKVTVDFQSRDTLLAALPEGSSLTAYITPDAVPEDFRSAIETFRTVGAAFAKQSGGRLVFSEVNPGTDPALQTRLVEELGVRPLARDLFGREVFWLHLVLQAGASVERIAPRGDLNQAELEQALDAAVKRVVPGQLRTVAILTEIPENEPPNPNLPPQFQPPQREADYRALRQILGETWSVRDEPLVDGYVPEDVDVLLVGKAAALTDMQRFAIDQFLMRGGSVVALAGAWRVSADRNGLAASKEDGSLRDLLRVYGVDVADALVYDPRNASFPVPVTERRGGFQLQRIEMVPYALFPDIRSDGLNPDHAALGGIAGITVPWASPLDPKGATDAGRHVEILARTSGLSWRDATGTIIPDLAAHPDGGFAPGATRQAEVVAATVTGKFRSAFAEAGNPLFSGAEDAQGRTLTESVDEGRLAVFGSSELVSDVLIQLAMSPTGEVHRGNLDLLQNTIDWSVEDTDLLGIRAGGAFTRTLEPLEDAARNRIEWLTVAGVLGPMFLALFFPLTRRWRVAPIALPGAPA
jgi:ABC-2 type transport system permease protein